MRRVDKIFGAYCAASLSAGWVIALGIGLLTWAGTLSRRDWEEALAQAILAPFWIGFVGLFLGVLICIFALLPSFPAVVVGEMVRIRSSRFYSAAGALSAPGALYLYSWWNGVGPFASAHRPLERTMGAVVSEAGFWALLVGAGLVGGYVYWRVAGKNAGEWRSPGATG